MRFALLLAIPAALALGGAAAPDPLAALAAAVGDPAALHLRAQATSTADGQQTVTTLDLQGSQRLLRTCVADVCAGTWFDGHRGWTFGLNEVPLPAGDDPALPALRSLAAIASYAFVEPAFQAAGGVVEAVAPNRWRVRAPDGAPLVATIDPRTLAVETVVDAGGTPIAQYGRIVRVGDAAFALQRAGPEERTFERVDLVAGPLGAPDGAPVTFGDPAPLALADDPVPIVPCRLGGRLVRCLLDTGTTPSAITLAFSEELGLEPHGELDIAGFHRFATGFVQAGPLALGPARFAQARFAVIPATRELHFDVIVGADLLGALQLTLDRAAATVTLGPTAPNRPADAIPLAFPQGVPLVDVTVAGVGVRALLDSGDAATLSLDYETYRRGPHWPPVARGEAIGVAGEGGVFDVDVPDVRIGTLDLGTVRTAVRWTQAVSHLGLGLAHRCALELDEAAGYLRCLPKRAELSPGRLRGPRRSAA